MVNQANSKIIFPKSLIIISSLINWGQVFKYNYLSLIRFYKLDRAIDGSIQDILLIELETKLRNTSLCEGLATHETCFYEFQSNCVYHSGKMNHI